MKGKKTGGRKKGTPNKSTLNLQERLDTLGFDAVDWLVAGLGSMPPFQQVDALLKLMEFLYPKRKAIQVDLKTLTDAELVAIVENRLTELLPSSETDETAH